jgi:hypothetical protein
MCQQHRSFANAMTRIPLLCFCMLWATCMGLVTVSRDTVSEVDFSSGWSWVLDSTSPFAPVDTVDAIERWSDAFTADAMLTSAGDEVTTSFRGRKAFLLSLGSFTLTAPTRMVVEFVADPAYDILRVDTVTVSLTQAFFTNSSEGASVVLTVWPSRGTVISTPQTVTEYDVRQGTATISLELNRHETWADCRGIRVSIRGMPFATTCTFPTPTVVFVSLRAFPTFDWHTN